MPLTKEGSLGCLTTLRTRQGHSRLQRSENAIRLVIWRELWPAQREMKKTGKPSNEGKSPRGDLSHSRPKRRTRSAFLLEADVVIPSVFRASFEGHLPYRRIIE
jgi:hypothetical protein